MLIIPNGRPSVSGLGPHHCLAGVPRSASIDSVIAHLGLGLSTRISPAVPFFPTSSAARVRARSQPCRDPAVDTALILRSPSYAPAFAISSKAFGSVIKQGCPAIQNPIRQCHHELSLCCIIFSTLPTCASRGAFRLAEEIR